MLISQNWKEIYITFAEYTAGYERYLDDSRNGQTMTRSPDNESFLRLQEFGPFRTDSCSHMANLGPFFLALSIYQSGPGVV